MRRRHRGDLLPRFANGALGAVSVSDTAVAPRSWEMTSAENPIYPHAGGFCHAIGGPRGSLSIPDLRPWTHDGSRGWHDPISAQDRSVGRADGFAHFLDVIVGARPPVSAGDGRDSLAAILMALEVGPEGRP